MASLDNKTKAKLDRLFEDTISPALQEDFEFSSKDQAKVAVQYLVSLIQNIDVEDLIFEEDDDREVYHHPTNGPYIEQDFDDDMDYD